MRQCQHQPPKRTFQREAENLELERQRPIWVAALDSERAEKNGEGSLGKDSDFSLLGAKGISVFCRREWLGAGESLLPQTGHSVNKNLFPSPPIIVLCLLMAAGGQIPLCLETISSPCETAFSYIYYSFLFPSTPQTAPPCFM